MFKLYKVSNPSVVMYFMKMYEGVVMAERLDRSEKKRKQAERQATASGGKQYTHNIKG